MIDEVLILNLDRHVERWYFMLGFLQSLHFPLRQVNRFDAHDGKGYENPEAVIDAAVLDGFPYFANHDYAYKYQRSPPSKYMIAANWTYASAWRQIAHNDKIVMLLIDDYQPIPGWTFGRLCSLMMHIYYHDADRFLMLQLKADPYGRPELPLPYQKPFTSILCRGLGGNGCYGLILNPAGAKFLLRFHPYMGVNYLEGIHLQEHENPEYINGCWHTIDSLVESHYFFETSRDRYD